MRVAIYIDTHTTGEDVKDGAGNNMSAGWYVYDWPLEADPVHGPYDLEEEAISADALARKEDAIVLAR